MRRSGFTLIELLIVVAIIGILAAIAVPNFMNAQVRAKVARAQSEMRSIQSALEAFYIDNSGYPPADCSNRLQMRRQYRGVDEDPSDWVVDFVHIMVGSGSSARRFYLTTPVAYISSLPADPFRGDGNEEGYGYGSNGQSYYILSSWGPDQRDGNEIEELFECHYTGARISDRNKVAFRESEQWLLQHEYNPSNGITSDGDIIRVGP
ncbi:MAG: prepilin-type N-terminal cleavage/methylation domain-containing protein [Candidatus Hinthialibacter antarcticus]|nr:prepilin-type N-terminal cleavage/methylation domain-containing protein [Candidatus Hinthialibacter antarcticus]